MGVCHVGSRLASVFLFGAAGVCDVTRHGLGLSSEIRSDTRFIEQPTRSDSTDFGMRYIGPAGTTYWVMKSGFGN